MTSQDKEFISRWSKRKLGAREGEDLPDGPQPVNLSEPVDAQIDGKNQPVEDAELTEADFEDVDFDTLDKSSDYTRFIKANVPAAIQKKALRKLWASDSVFEVLDGMNDYDEDFTGDGLAGKVFKTAHKVGRGFLTDEVEEETVEADSVEIVDAEEAGEEPMPVEAELTDDDGEEEDTQNLS